MQARDHNTDGIRATAITLVVIGHVAQVLMALPREVRQYTGLGAYGVDLFFVLSGWLIGGLYWREKARFGSVDVLRFWKRRWTRTVPPYLVALVLAFTAVRAVRGDGFDWRYLLFLQNYETKLPYFGVSWSLCVEEHFYLTMPLLLAGLAMARVRIGWALLVLTCAPTLFRVLDPNALPQEPFGYAYTATHLRFEGLLLGVWLAFLRQYHQQSFDKLQRPASLAFFPLLAIFLTVPLWPPAAKFYLSAPFVSVLWGSLLVAVVGRAPLAVFKSQFVHRVALWSYSIYLTHALVLHSVQRVTASIGVRAELVFPLWIAIMLATGWAFYRAVEVPSLRLRDRWFPNRPNYPSNAVGSAASTSQRL